MTPEARRRQRVRFPVLALTAAAWTGLLLLGMPHVPAGAEPGALTPSAGQPAGPAITAHVHGAHAQGPGGLPLLVLTSALMLVAMTAPLLVPALRHVHERSLPPRRVRAAALLVCGYASAWAVAWLALLVVGVGLRAALGDAGALLAGFLLVVVWQASPVKQRSLNRCHSRPALAAFGPAADRDALLFGLRLAGRCVGSCWALMLLPLLLPGHSWLSMGAVAAWMWAERWEPPAPAHWRLRVPRAAPRMAAGQARAWATRTAGLRSRA